MIERFSEGKDHVESVEIAEGDGVSRVLELLLSEIFRE